MWCQFDTTFLENNLDVLRLSWLLTRAEVCGIIWVQSEGGIKMRFYYNEGMNICAEETWVTDYLFMDGMFDLREEALEELRTKHEVYGWFECEVSNTIDEKFFD